MPANIVLRDLTNPPIKGNSSPIIATRADLRDGTRGDTTGGGPAAASGGTPALSYTIASFQRDAEVTLTTDGTHDFGAVGPELVIMFDATITDQAGNVAPILGPNTTVLAGELLVVPQPAMPGGVGYRMGTVNGAGTGFDVQCVAHMRGFESRTYFWPPENRPAANQYLLDPATDGDNKDWQIKPLWNMSDRNYGAADTDFFMVTHERLNSGAMSWKQEAFLSSNSIASIYGANTQVKASGTPSDEPLEEPYTTEFFFDQVSVDQEGVGYFQTLTSSPSVGSHYGKEVKSGLTLHESTGTTKVINTFTYPGYIRGFSEKDLGYSTFDGEVYKAAGPGAACRVVISDTPIVDNASKKTILEPVSWSATEVKVKLRGGWWGIDNLAGKYLCVVGANNQQIGSGVQL